MTGVGSGNSASMFIEGDNFAETRRLLWRAGAGVIGLFWMIQLGELTLVGMVEGRHTALYLLEHRAIVVSSGVLLSVPIIAVAARGVGRPFRSRLFATVGVALLMCATLMAVNYGATFVAFPSGRAPFNPVEFIYTAFGWSWFFLGLAGAVVGLAYSTEVRDRERRLAMMSEVARDARLAALRYQLNPHFLFNTLNSIASLIDAGEGRPAEAMVLSLSDFLRATLELDPLEDIPLSRELELQALYLSIEMARFPERLSTRHEIADDVRGELIPALITQPIIENAIRHAVARTKHPVQIAIEAARIGNRLRVSISDNGNAGSSASGGTGVGLANIRARLESRFGTNHKLEAGRTATGYRVVIEIPLRRSGR